MAELIYRGGTGATTTTASGTTGFPRTPVSKGDLVLVYCDAAATMTSLTISGGGGTWAKIAGEYSNGTNFFQVWIGWGFDGNSTTYSYSRTGTANIGLASNQWAWPAPVTSQPTVTLGTLATGTSTAPASPSITPAVGDLVFDFAMWANVTASSARADTPGGSEGQATGQALAITANRAECAFRTATSTSAILRTWTITSAAWLANSMRITPSTTATAALVDTTHLTSLPAATPVTVAGFAYKGRSTAANDTSSNGVV